MLGQKAHEGVVFRRRHRSVVAKKHFCTAVVRIRLPNRHFASVVVLAVGITRFDEVREIITHLPRKIIVPAAMRARAFRERFEEKPQINRMKGSRPVIARNIGQKSIIIAWRRIFRLILREKRRLDGALDVVHRCVTPFTFFPRKIKRKEAIRTFPENFPRPGFELLPVLGDDAA